MTSNIHHRQLVKNFGMLKSRDGKVLIKRLLKSANHASREYPCTTLFYATSGYSQRLRNEARKECAKIILPNARYILGSVFQSVSGSVCCCFFYRVYNLINNQKGQCRHVNNRIKIRRDSQNRNILVGILFSIFSRKRVSRNYF